MEFDGSVRVGATAGQVFALLADVQEVATGPGSPVVAMEKLPPGPTRVGTRWREVVRLGPGLHLTMWSEVTEVVPDRRLAMRFRGGRMQGELTYTISPDDGGSVLRQQETMHVVGRLRPLDRLAGWMLRRRLGPRLRDIAALFPVSPAGTT